MSDPMRIKWHRLTGATIIILMATIILWMLH